MTNLNQGVWSDPALCGVALVASGIFSLLGRLNELVISLLVPSTYTWWQWWPVLAVVLGVVLLIADLLYRRMFRNATKLQESRMQ